MKYEPREFFDKYIELEKNLRNLCNLDEEDIRNLPDEVLAIRLGSTITQAIFHHSGLLSIKRNIRKDCFGRLVVSHFDEIFLEDAKKFLQETKPYLEEYEHSRKCAVV